MSVHITVLLEETVQALAPHSGGVYVDGTLGAGGHTERLLQKSAPGGRVLSFDVNRKALEKARERFASCGDRWQGIERNFAELEAALLQEGIRQVDGILLDLGFSSDELLDPEIGLSFARPGVLDMRLGEAISDDGLTAAHVVNQGGDSLVWRRTVESSDCSGHRSSAQTRIHHSYRCVGASDCGCGPSFLRARTDSSSDAYLSGVAHSRERRTQEPPTRY